MSFWNYMKNGAIIFVIFAPQLVAGVGSCGASFVM